MTLPPTFRSEHDFLGERQIPRTAYYGVHTLRAIENFPITGQPISTYPELIYALAAVKKAAVMANNDLDLLPEEHASAVAAACDEIMAGQWHEHFAVDVIQGGAGTSTNMNANEVIANRALEIMGYEKGDFDHIHPNETVNFGQSTNDVYPTAIHIALWRECETFLSRWDKLIDAFLVKGEAYAHLVKMGRTQLQDAVPMTLGQELRAWAESFKGIKNQLRLAQEALCEVNLGGTAIGTGIATHPEFSRRAITHLAALTGIPLKAAPDLIAATQDVSAMLGLSHALKAAAVRASKTANDFRLLSSGPRAGLAELKLPAVQAGSSIMAGKLNPVIPEMLNQVAFEVIGNDLTISFAAEGGQLELNPFEPIIAHSLFKSIQHLGRAVEIFVTHCVEGMTANIAQLEKNMAEAIGVVTALNPYIGYEQAAEVAQEAFRSGKSVREVISIKGLLSEAELDTILVPERMCQPQPFQRPKSTNTTKQSN